MFKPLKTIKDSKIIHLDLKLDVCNLKFKHFLTKFWISTPQEKKFLRENQGKSMARELNTATKTRTKLRNKAIMTRSRLRNKYLKEKSADSKSHVINKDITVHLLHRTKKNDFANMSINPITDNKKFCKTNKTLFWCKISHKRQSSWKCNNFKGRPGGRWHI